MGTYINATDIYSNNLYAMTTTIADTATMNLYIDGAQDEMDGYFKLKYTIPLTSTSISNYIKKLNREMAVAYMYIDMYPSDNASQNEWATFKLADAREQLKKIADGEILLANSGTAQAVAATSRYLSTRKGYPLPADMDSPYDWKVPGQLESQIDTARTAAE